MNLEVRYNDMYMSGKITSVLIKRIHRKHSHLHGFVFCSKRSAHIFGFQADETSAFLPRSAAFLNRSLNTEKFRDLATIT